MNRNAEYRGQESARGRRPRLIDLRASGELEQSADIVCGIYRPDQRGHELFKPCEFHVLKNRSGRTGMTHFSFDAPYYKFDDLDEQGQEQAARDISDRESNDDKPTTPADRVKGGKR